jgi:hypothetical protein
LVNVTEAGGPQPSLFDGWGDERWMMDQKERYRRHATLCYEIAAGMTGERAASMTRLGDAYAALAVDADHPLNTFVPPTKYAEPRCRKCGKQMHVTLTLPRTDIMPAMQDFRCASCGETLIWKGKHARSGDADTSVVEPMENLITSMLQHPSAKPDRGLRQVRSSNAPTPQQLSCGPN